VFLLTKHFIRHKCDALDVNRLLTMLCTVCVRRFVFASPLTRASYMYIYGYILVQSNLFLLCFDYWHKLAFLSWIVANSYLALHFAVQVLLLYNSLLLSLFVCEMDKKNIVSENCFGNYVIGTELPWFSQWLSYVREPDHLLKVSFLSYICPAPMLKSRTCSLSIKLELKILFNRT